MTGLSMLSVRGVIMRVEYEELFNGNGPIRLLDSVYVIYDITLCLDSLDPRPSDLCILMEGLVRDDHVG